LHRAIESMRRTSRGALGSLSVCDECGSDGRDVFSKRNGLAPCERRSRFEVSRQGQSPKRIVDSQHGGRRARINFSNQRRRAPVSVLSWWRPVHEMPGYRLEPHHPKTIVVACRVAVSRVRRLRRMCVVPRIGSPQAVLDRNAVDDRAGAFVRGGHRHVRHRVEDGGSGRIGAGRQNGAPGLPSRVSGTTRMGWPGTRDPAA
jgi:hypothetical protein